MTVLKAPKPIKPFQHTAARRRLSVDGEFIPHMNNVSTHSRPKAADCAVIKPCTLDGVSTHSRPKAAEPSDLSKEQAAKVSTHSRPKAAEDDGLMQRFAGEVSTHSRPKAAESKHKQRVILQTFQHTAARRRLINSYGLWIMV